MQHSHCHQGGGGRGHPGSGLYPQPHHKVWTRIEGIELSMEEVRVAVQNVNQLLKEGQIR